MGGTRVVFPDGVAVQFDERLEVREAKRRAIRERRKRHARINDPVEHAIARHEEFNFRPARELKRLKVDLKTPLIRIGKVPEIHYESDKEGKPVHYMHVVKRKGTLYAHPDGKYFLLIGGSTKVREWLYD